MYKNAEKERQRYVKKRSLWDNDKWIQRGRLGGGEEERIGGEVEEKDNEQPISK